MLVSLSLDKKVSAFPGHVFARQTYFRLSEGRISMVDAFSLLRAKSSIGKSVRALRETCSLVTSFSPLRGMFSLGKRFFDRLVCFRYVDAYSLFNMRFRLGNAFSSLHASFSLGKKRFRLSEARFR